MIWNKGEKTMQEIKCPKCGEAFVIDESGYAEIVRQVRDSEFQKELSYRENEPSLETLRFALSKVKANVYTEALHPNYRKGTFLEQKAAANDQRFILANLDKIEAILYTYYDAVKNGEAPEMSPEEMIKKGVKSAREMLQK